MIYDKPRELMISSTIQIMFFHKPSNAHAVCKVDIRRLNWKLRKLQNEGMFIVGIFFEDPNKPVRSVQIDKPSDPLSGPLSGTLEINDSRFVVMTEGDVANV